MAGYDWGPGDRIMLGISGRIREQDVATLWALLEQERSVVAIDLKDVLIVHRDATPLLVKCESNGVELRNCPAYIREWVTRDTTDKNASEGRTEGRGDTEDA
jgi:hypothetical protein